MRKFPEPFSAAWMIGVAVFRAGFGLHQGVAAGVPAGFTETVITPPNGGSWNEAAGVTFSAAEGKRRARTCGPSGGEFPCGQLPGGHGMTMRHFKIAIQALSR